MSATDIFKMYKSFQDDCKIMLEIHCKYIDLLDTRLKIQDEKKRINNINNENKNVRRVYTRQTPNDYSSSYNPITNQPTSIINPINRFRNDRKYRSTIQSPIINNLLDRKHGRSLFRSYLFDYDTKHNNRASTSSNTIVINDGGDEDMTPVIVKPTQQQISDATKTYLFKEVKNPISHVCPIDKEIFLENDEVVIINHCRHIFRKHNLDKWFEEHVKCPLCRYDIREYNILNNVIQQGEEDAEEIIIEDF